MILARMGLWQRQASTGEARRVVPGFAAALELCEPCDVAATPEQTARTLCQRSLAVRQERRARAERIRRNVLGIVREHLPPKAQAWLIGSLAWGCFDEHSDVDLVLCGVSRDQATKIELALVGELGIAPPFK